MLSLDKQNRYRERYRILQTGWHTSGEVYTALVRQYVGGHVVALDLGCGAGGVMERLGDAVGLLIGADRHLPSLRANRVRTLHSVLCDADALPFRSESFDLIVSSWVIEHITRPDRLFTEVGRVLKRGGHFIFLTPNAANYIAMINRLIPRLMQAGLVRAVYGRQSKDTFPVVYRANTLHALRALSHQAGLQVTALQTVHDPTYLAFNTAAFHLSAFIERFVPDERAIHIVGDLVKP